VALPATASAQTLYSSLPLSGAARAQTKAVNDGARLALQEAGNPVKFVTLNDATRKAGSWTPERVSANALKAARDDTTLAYIGEFNSGASQVAIPILNEAGVPTISPSNTYNGLTKRLQPGEPDRFYPTGERTFFRIVPNDTVQAAALTTAMRDRGCRRIAVVNDGLPYSRGMQADVRETAKRLGLPVVASERLKRHMRSYRGLVRSLRRPDCVAYAGITAGGAVPLFKALPAKAQLFAGDGVAESGFAAHLPASVAGRTTITIATLAPDAYGPPAPAVFARNRDPYTVYGYEAMKLILDGFRAGANNKGALLQWLRTVKDRPSALGTYSFDANGDTTLRTYGLYTIKRKTLTWVRAITAA
jgi:branched-chain amino acid transport system substrate-binding protein